MEIDTKYYIMDLRQWPISPETQARPHEIICRKSEVGGWDSCLSYTDDANDPTPRVAHFNDPLLSNRLIQIKTDNRQNQLFKKQPKPVRTRVKNKRLLEMDSRLNKGL